MQTVSKLRVRRFPHRAGVSLRSVSIAVADRPVPLSRVWSGSKIIAEDLTGEDISDVLELHSDASAWWVLPRDHDYGALEVRHIAQALDLDEPAIRDLLAEDRRAKFDTIGQARLVITNAVSIDKDSTRITAHPVSLIATDRAVICLVDPNPDFQPAQLFCHKEEMIAKGGIEAAVQMIIAGRHPQLSGGASVARGFQRRAWRMHYSRSARSPSLSSFTRSSSERRSPTCGG